MFRRSLIILLVAFINYLVGAILIGDKFDPNSTVGFVLFYGTLVSGLLINVLNYIFVKDE